MIYIGIDPGVTGAWAAVRTAQGSPSAPPTLLTVQDLPTYQDGKHKRLDASALIDQLTVFSSPLNLDRLAGDGLPVIGHVAVELLVAPPGVASTTAFSMGWTAATVDCALILSGLAAVSDKVAPVVWKRAMRVTSDKASSLSRANELFGPDNAAQWWPLKKHHNRAEAALIAAWAAKHSPAPI